MYGLVLSSKEVQALKGVLESLDDKAINWLMDNVQGADEFIPNVLCRIDQLPKMQEHFFVEDNFIIPCTPDHGVVVATETGDRVVAEISKCDNGILVKIDENQAEMDFNMVAKFAERAYIQLQVEHYLQYKYSKRKDE